MSTLEVKGRKAEQSEATRAELVRAARELFAEHGYAATGTDQIVQRAGVTRGALYHHFPGKEDLFRVVYEEVQRDLIQAILAAATAVTASGWQARLKAAFGAYLDFFLQEGTRRIVLQDAPAVLDWDARNEIHLRQGLGSMIAALQAAMNEGVIEQQPAPELAHVLHGALNEGAMTIARAPDVQAARAQIGAAIDRMLPGLTTRAGKKRKP